MNKLITTHIGGFPLFTDDFKFTDKAYRDAFVALVSHLDYTTILSGCQRTQNGLNVSITEGYVALSGEILHLPHQSYTLQNVSDFEYFALDVSFDANGLKHFKNNVQHNTYQVRKAKVVISSSPVPNKTRIQQVPTIYQVFEHNIPQIGNNTTEIAKQATETQQGRIEIATQAETNNGTDDTRAITPKKLNAYTSQVLMKGQFSLGTITSQSIAAKTIAFQNIGTTHYMVFGTLKFTNGYTSSSSGFAQLVSNGTLTWTLGEKRVDGFDIAVFDHRSHNLTGQIFFDFMIVKI